MALTPKQERFVEEYLVDLNGTQAAIRAGYSPKTANEQASVMLAKPSIQEAVQAQRAKVSERTEIKQDSVVKELARLALSDVRKIFNADGSVKHPGELDDDTAAAVSSVELDPDGGFKIKFWDKNSAADKLMKFLGAYEPQRLAIDHKHEGDSAASMQQAIIDALNRKHSS